MDENKCYQTFKEYLEADENLPDNHYERTFNTIKALFKICENYTDEYGEVDLNTWID